MRPAAPGGRAAFLALLLAGAVSGAAGAEPRALLTRSLEVRCGAERCADLLEVRRRGTVIYPSPDGDRVVPLAIEVRPAASFRLVTGAGAERRVRTLDGDRATESLADGAPTPLDEGARASLRRTLDADEAFLLGRALAGDLKIAGLGNAGPGEAPGQLPEAGLVAVELIGSDGAALRLVLPAEGGLPLRLDYPLAGPAGSVRGASEIYSDWRPVQGMLLPFEVTVWSAAAPVAVFRYDVVEVVRSPPAGSPAAAP